MRQLVGAKTDRAHRASGETPPLKIDDLVQKVDCPQEQIELLCNVLRALLQYELAAEKGHGAVRVACFGSDGQHLRPIYSYDGVSRDFLSSVYPGYAEHFDLAGAAKTSLAVAAARQHRIMIVADAKKANDDSGNPFWFFGPTQRETLQSIVAIPVGCVTDSRHASYVLCFDTGCLGFFSESHREQYELLQQNIEPRLLYESYIMMLDKKQSHGRTNDHVT